MRSGTFQFSIRGILLGCTLLALALATLPYSAWSGFWAMILSTVACGVFLFAVLSGVFRRGPRQAFWGGFAIAGIAYLVLVLWILSTTAYHGVGSLATTRLLWQFESLVRREIDVPPETPGAKTILPDGTVFGFAGGGFGGGIGSRTVVDVPNHENLMLSGQLLWALVIGYAGGLLARYLYLTRESPKSSSG